MAKRISFTETMLQKIEDEEIDLHFLLKLDKNINMYRINKCIQLQIHYFNRKNVHIEYMISVYILNQQLKQSRVNHKIML